MNIAIIDDSESDRIELLTLLDQFFEKYDFSPETDVFSSAESFLAAFEKEKYDLCFIDIFLPGLNGMDTASEIYAADPDCILIFLSSSDQYISDGYRVKALRYLLKPISGSQLNDVLPECIEAAVLNHRRLPVNINRKDREIPFTKIYYISSSAKTEVHLKDIVYALTSRKSFFATVEPLLKDYRFITCSRGIVVNMAHVQKIDKDCFIMENGDRVPISRRQYVTVNDRFMDFQFEHLL